MALLCVSVLGVKVTLFTEVKNDLSPFQFVSVVRPEMKYPEVADSSSVCRQSTGDVSRP